MTNDEAPMTKEALKLEGRIDPFRNWGFFRHWRFVIRHELNCLIRLTNCRIWVTLLALTFSAHAQAAETTAIHSPTASNAVVVPFQFQRDHMMVRVRVNESEPLLFMVDSGYALNMISPEQASA